MGRVRLLAARLAGVLLFGPSLIAQTSDKVLLVVNGADRLSRRIGDYYVYKRSIPLKNVCKIDVLDDDEEIPWDRYIEEIEQPVARCLSRAHLQEQILYIVTTMGVPLKVAGGGSGPAQEGCAVDSELALLYSKMQGRHYAKPGAVVNPFFGHKDEPLTHPRFPLYLVTRLAGYSFEDVKGIIDRSLAARNQGRFVFDLKSGDNAPGNNWLRTAARSLPADRVVIDESTKVLSGLKDVIGYASWGSNDPNRHQRDLGFQWLPGALVTEYVSSNGRTFERPPEHWTLGTWKDSVHWFAGSPQSLTADYIHQGATGASGHVYEPFLDYTPHPDLLFPAYFHGRNLAESYYLAIPGLSWMNIVIGDPLCKLR